MDKSPNFPAVHLDGDNFEFLEVFAFVKFYRVKYNYSEISFTRSTSVIYEW